MKAYLNLFTFFCVSKIFSFFYIPFEHKEKLIYINWENKKGFSLSTNKENISLLRHYGSFPSTPQYDYIENFDENQTVNPWLVPDPKTSSVKSINAKELGLLQFRKVSRYLGNPYYCVGSADVHKIGDKNALYVTDYYTSTITPIVCKKVQFYSPITYKGQTLYYGFAKKENRYWIYEICAKTKKINWFFTELTELNGDDLSMSVLSNTKIVGQGKINEKTVLFSFDLTSKTLNTIDLGNEEIEKIYLPSTEFKLKYETYCSQIVSHIAQNSSIKELGFIKFKNQKLISTWDIKNNKINREFVQVSPIFFSEDILLDNKNQVGMKLHDKKNNLVYSVYIENNNLIANQMDLKTTAQKDISLPNIEKREFQYLFHDTKSEKIIFSFSTNDNIDWYYADFNKNLLKRICFPVDLSKNILPTLSILWEKEQILMLFSTNDLFEIPYSTLQAKKILFSKRNKYMKKISLFQTKNQYAYRFLNSNKGNVIEKLDLKRDKSFVLNVPQLKNKSADLYYENPNKFYNFYKYGPYFVGFNIDQQKIINYNIPNQKFDYQWQVKDLKIFTKQIKNDFWIWIADTKKYTVTTLKFPDQLPKGYFNLQNYVIKESWGKAMPNQKWIE